MFNQLALNSNTYHGYSIEEAIKGASRAGFKKIELAAVKDHTAHVRPETPQSEIKQIKSLLKEKDIEVIGISAHSNVLTVEGIANLLETIELSVIFNCRYIVTATGDSHGDRDVIKENSQLKEKLAVVIEKCRKLNKQLVIETHGNNYATGKSLQQFIR